MRLFRWLCASEVPPCCDLRRRGWSLLPPLAPEPHTSSIAIAHVAGVGTQCWLTLAELAPGPRGRTLLLGVGRAGERERLLRLGFGEVLGQRFALGELEARAERVASLSDRLPRTLMLGRLTLDLFARDGFVDGRPLGFHPREFALLWRLAESPGAAVGKPALVSEVWRRLHVPDTNSLAVHVSRLRGKLASAGLAGLVQTAASGGYMLTPDFAEPAIPLARERQPLDAYTRAGNAGDSTVTSDSPLCGKVLEGIGEKGTP